MPNIEAQVAIIGGERFITACDVKDIDQTAFVIQKASTCSRYHLSGEGKHAGCFNVS